MVNHILTVRGRKASVTPRTLVQGTVGQDTLTLDLDSEWNGLNVTVTFVAATIDVTPVLNANVCEIPHEVLVDSGEVDVFVLGTRDGKAMRHASLAHKMVVKKSNMSDGSTTADPSISAYRQAYDDAVKATEAANSAAGAAGSTAAEMATLNKRYAAQIEQQATEFSTDQIQRANDFSTAQTQRAHEFDSAMQGYENAFNEAEGERAADETERVKAEEERGKAEEKRAQDSKTRLEELAQAKTNAETATGEANTARDEAKKAATDATSAAGKATDAASLAETAKTNANTAAEEANAAATKAETAARKADGAAETAGTAASTAERAANKADTAAGNAEIMAEKADASANKADIAAGKANEATVAATNAATKANEVEAKLTGNILKGKVKETFIHVDDAFPSSLLGIDIEGATEQITTTGKNLINGCDSFFREADTTSKSYLWGYTLGSNPLVLNKPLEAGTYTFSFYSMKGCAIYFSKKPYVTGHFVNFICNKVVSGDTRFGLKRFYGTFTLDDTYELIGMYCENYNECFGGMIEKGSTVTAYEPYTGGKPSPSPEYPQEIKVIENPVVKVKGRNLADVSEAYYINSGGRKPEKIPDGFRFVITSDANRIINIPCELKKGDKIVVNFDEKKLSGTATKIDIYFNELNVYVGKGKPLVMVGDTSYIGIYVDSGTVGEFDVTNFRVTRNVDEGYKPYTSQLQSFTLPAEHPYLAKLPDGTADEIIVDKDGNVELVARVGKYVATGDESLFYNDAADEFYITGTPIAGGAGYSPELPFVPTTQHTFGFSTSDSGALYMSVPGVVTSYDSAVAWLKSIRPSFYGNIATPITYNLGKIEMRKAQDSIVNVWTDAEITPRTGIEYARDVNIVVANLESAIASITQV